MRQPLNVLIIEDDPNYYEPLKKSLTEVKQITDYLK